MAKNDSKDIDQNPREASLPGAYPESEDDRSKPPSLLTKMFRKSKAAKTSLSTSTSRPSRKQLMAVAAETNSVLRGILPKMPACEPEGFLIDNIPELQNFDSWKHGKIETGHATVQVVNADSLDAALTLFGLPKTVSTPEPSTFHDKPIVILNLANPFKGGGGWLNGSLAQEECLCYRSSLSWTLKPEYYPLSPLGAIYSPRVVVLRHSLFPSDTFHLETEPHSLVDLTDLGTLPLVSVITVAAIERPETTKSNNLPSKPSTSRASEPYETFAHSADYELTRAKIAQILRIAASQEHRKIVLGALGCGVFGNPSRQVAIMFREALEQEWKGREWWEGIVFAVLDLSAKKRTQEDAEVEAGRSDQAKDQRVPASNASRGPKGQHVLGKGNHRIWYEELNGLKI